MRETLRIFRPVLVIEPQVNNEVVGVIIVDARGNELLRCDEGFDGLHEQEKIFLQEVADAINHHKGYRSALRKIRRIREADDEAGEIARKALLRGLV